MFGRIVKLTHADVASFVVDERKSDCAVGDVIHMCGDGDQCDEEHDCVSIGANGIVVCPGDSSFVVGEAAVLDVDGKVCKDSICGGHYFSVGMFVFVD